MAIQYKITKYTNENSSLNGGYYARAIITENIDLDDLAQHIQDHHSVYSRGTIKGVLSEMVSCIRELCLEGKSITLDDLATFSIGLKSKVVSNIDDFNVNTCISGVRLRMRASGEMTSAELTADATLKEMTDYDSPRNTSDTTTKSDDTTDDTTDTSGDDSGSSSSGSSGDDGDVSV